MDGVGGTSLLKILGPKASGIVVGTGGFRPNGASAPSSSFYRGTLAGLFTVTYGATGLYTVQFSPTKFTFPAGRFPYIEVSNTCKDQTGTNRFQVQRKGNWDNTNRQFIIQACQEATAFQVPSDADNWIDFFIFAQTK